jgi:putative membrane protein
MSFKTTIAAVLAAPVILAAPLAYAVDKPVDFVTKASNAGMFEIKSSELALKKSKNPTVIAFAKEMIADHKAAAAKLDTAAKAANIVPPKVISNDEQAKVDDLAKKGDDFDKAYIDAQASAHNDAVNLFSDFSKNGESLQLQNFATATLPTLAAHKAKVDDIKAKM